ncbi:hypothetical protein TNCV_3468241 [Trichonephila clavipes]|nr:hypothetical protein TNCV_3468241 [Trichonephila clavipes]
MLSGVIILHYDARLNVSKPERYQANGSYCEGLDVLPCPKPIPKVNLIPRPKYNTAIVSFTRVKRNNIQGNAQICQSRTVEQNIHR